MSGSQITTTGVNDSTQAFDYVSGVMRGAKRKAFTERLAREPELQAQVNYWEEELMRLSNSEQALRPAEATWANIEARINRIPSSVSAFWPRWLWPSVSATACLLLTTWLWFFQAQGSPQQLNADYVAVLTTEAGAAPLTVLTASGGEHMWLKWNQVAIAPEKSLQLWAISKRDGQIRPLGVFSSIDSVNVPLTIAQLRLIKDAAYLLLTEEDAGGSPLDEPSDTVIAKGVCVLLVNTEKTI